MSNKISRRAFLKCAGVSAAAVGSASLLSGCKTNGSNTTVNDVKVGDTVKRGDVLVEAETDKAVLPVECFTAGQVLDVLVKEGDAVTAGTVLAVIGSAEDAAAYHRGGAQAPAAPTAPAAPAAPAAVPVQEDEEYLPIIKGQPVVHAAPAAPAHAYPAMPNAKMLAKERGVDLGKIVPSNGVPHHRRRRRSTRSCP